MGNAVGGAVQIIQLYDSGVERLKKEEDWPHVWPAFTCESMEVSDQQGVLYLHGALGAGKSKRGLRVETVSDDDL